ncbi:MAG TPA: hypothetical protein VMZ52_12790 [Bryobacteraceae bacterium]|nr:hypothetical protein [Bryobacteraceae bacterium]
MSVPPIPPPLEHLGQRPFSFYPPILNSEHNEWLFRKATWSEILVSNTKTQAELWVPRRFLGNISRIDEPVMILGLLKELEYTAGQVLPHERRIIEMPRAVNDRFRPAGEEAAPQTAPVVGIRLESGAESRIGRLIGAVLFAGVFACVVIVSLFRGSHDGSRITYTPVLQSDVGLTGADDYYAVVRKLGTPSQDRWRSEQGEFQYRVLGYPEKSLFVILMGSRRENAVYIGSMNNEWKPAHYVTQHGGGSTHAMLKSIPRF